MSLPLEGLKVVDLTRVLAGPYCTMLLSDFGAEIIKVENPDGGDDSRAFPEFFEGESTYFMSINRNKKSVTLNLKTDEAREILKKLISTADILVENFRPGYMDKIGFGFEACQALNPKLIYASISGYGHSGPWKEKPGYDLVVQGTSGVMSLTGLPNEMPFKMGVSIADFMAGINCFQAILLSIMERQKTQAGKRVDVSLMDGMVSTLSFHSNKFLMTGKKSTRKGNSHPSISPYETFQTADGWLNVAIGNDKLWKQLCDLMPNLTTINCDKFKLNAGRVQFHDELFELLKPIFQSKSTNDWVIELEKVGIPCGPILNVHEVLELEQLKARNMILTAKHVKGFDLKVLNNPLNFNPAHQKVSAPPTLGQHTEMILRELGYSNEDIQSLKEKNVI